MPVNPTAARPNYLSDNRLDDLARMVAELTSQVWVLKDRNMILEKLLADAGVLEAARIDEYLPDTETAAALAAERDAFVSRVFGAVLDHHERVDRALGNVAG
ncbi:hypothetical protein [Rhodococcus sp. NPDC047139]|uniref:hypothetical protein n=1 Tax=Rhodococcus sp. NPDC047139 TaxID=3155141 RepID=UPI0033EAB23A